MRITVVGAGHVGLVVSACLADLGHEVTCLDVDEDKIARLRVGRLPMYEPGVQDLVVEAMAAGRLRFVSSYPEATADADLMFVAVGTPSNGNGEVELAQLGSVIESAAPHLKDGVAIVIKSTVPVGTTREVGRRIADLRPDIDVALAANPEFLRQGSAVADFLRPDRIVIGTASDAAEEVLLDLYRPLTDRGVPALFTDLETAELIKYASNAFLAIKLSFLNEVADLCEVSGASVDLVAEGMGLDHRIGPAYLTAGPGFGGSCLPKDVQGLLHTSGLYGTRSTIVAAALEVNESRRRQMVDKLRDALPKPLAESRIAVLGLTYKADTDDLRSSPAIDIVRELAGMGAEICAYDPRGMELARKALPATVEFASDAFDAMRGADCALIATEWDEFARLDLGAVREALVSPVIVDLRNLYTPGDVAAAGLRYVSVGRPTAEPAS